LTTKLPVLILPKGIIVLHKENVPWRFSMHDIIDLKSLAILHVSLRWKSSFASHVEMFYVPLNVWRELELLPNFLGQGLFGQRAGSVLKASFSPGSLMPAHNDDRVRLFPQESFAQGRRVPRLGRFYPQGLLPGYAQNPQPFRCTAISDGGFSADFNHPLAKQPLELEITIDEQADATISFYGRRTLAGARIWLDLEKLKAFPPIYRWYMRLAPKPELPLEILVDAILVAGRALLSATPIRIIHFAARQKKGPTAVCRDCGEAYPVSQGPQCLACQGRKYYAEPDPSPL
jgi:hypothetical protein